MCSGRGRFAQLDDQDGQSLEPTLDRPQADIYRELGVIFA